MPNPKNALIAQYAVCRYGNNTELSTVVHFSRRIYVVNSILLIYTNINYIIFISSLILIIIIIIKRRSGINPIPPTVIDRD